MRAVRWCTIPLLTLALALATVAGTARADDLSVLQAVQKQASKISGNRDFKRVHNIRVHNAGQARRAIGPLRRVESRLRSSADTVNKTSGSSKVGRAAKRDWVAGTRELAYGYGKLVESCRDLEGGRVGASNSAAYRAVRSFKNAGKTLTRANRELRQASKGLGL